MRAAPGIEEAADIEYLAFPATETQESFSSAVSNYRNITCRAADRFVPSIVSKEDQRDQPNVKKSPL